MTQLTFIFEEKTYERYHFPLLDCVLGLHMIKNGSYEVFGSEGVFNALLTYEFVKWRIKDWQPSHKKDKKFDDLVKKLCETALEEFKNKELRSMRKAFKQWKETKNTY